MNSMKQVLIDALEAAGEIQLKHYQSDHSISVKENFTSIVTETDLESEKKIIEVIRSHYPHHTILSEESGLTAMGSSYTWIIDPIDGTSNYAAGLPWFGPLIAILKDGIPLAGGAYLPVTGEMFIAEYGKGATLNGDAVRVRDADMKDILVAYSNNYTEDEGYLDTGMKLYRYLLQNSRNVRTTNSLIDLMNVAGGKYGGCVIMYNGVWDVAAPWLIIREAGGYMKNLDGSEVDFRVRPEILQLNYPIVAGSEGFVKRILDVVRNIV